MTTEIAAVRLRHRVAESDTAVALGSGDVPVLATPRLLAWIEGATVEAAHGSLTPGQTSVGVTVRLEHLRSSAVGEEVEVAASAPSVVSTRRLRFEVTAYDDAGRLVAQGEVERAIVDRGRFLSPPAAPEER